MLRKKLTLEQEDFIESKDWNDYLEMVEEISEWIDR